MSDELSKDKHAQMIELIIVLFKNLVSVPPKNNNLLEDQTFSIELLKQFKEKSVLDSLVYMTQKFESTFAKKLAFHFIEIFYNIYRYYSPFEFFAKPSSKSFFQIDKEQKQKRLSQLPTRHGRFNTQIVTRDKFGQSKRIHHSIQQAQEEKQTKINGIDKQRSAP